MKRKILLLFIPLILLLSITAPTAANVKGKNSYRLPITEQLSRSSIANFSKNYVLTEDGATNMLKIAKAQIGKAESDLNYTKPWSADFILDCAKLANQMTAIPCGDYKNLQCSDISQCIRKAGATLIIGTTKLKIPQAGDIIFYGYVDYPDLLNNEQHAGIVSKYSNGKIYTIEGNLYGKVRNSSAYQTGRKLGFPYYYILRPNYNEASYSNSSLLNNLICISKQIQR